MGYKKSFNLVTLQLIIPLSTMTKAEYKNAYGIDLDDIDIEKVTLLQEDGSKNKYFVDEVKTTESGIDIYAGGKILSIGSSVSVVNNAYSVENSKPIYCHPIVIIDNDGSIPKRFAGLIFNNSSTPFTLDSFKAWLDNLKEVTSGQGKLVITGAVSNTDGICITSYIYKASNNSYIISGLTTLGSPLNITTGTFEQLLPAATTDFQDGVNKIN